MKATEIKPARVKQIAAWLPERPAGPGAPAADRAAWDALAKRLASRRIVSSAEREMATPLPTLANTLYLEYSRTGNRTRWQDVNDRRRQRFRRLVLAECVENKGRFLPAIRETLESICAERVWVYPAHDPDLSIFEGKRTHVDLKSALLAWEIATADHLLGDALGAELRKRVRRLIRERVFDPYRESIRTNDPIQCWWRNVTNNWNAACLAGVTGAALALVESRDERAYFVAAAEAYSRNYLAGLPPDGYCTEGLGYWNFGFGHYVLLAEVIARETGGHIRLMDRNGTREAAWFGRRLEIVNRVYPAFADCPLGVRPDPKLMEFVGRCCGIDWPAPPARRRRGMLYAFTLRAFPDPAPKRPPSSDPAKPVGLRTWFDRAGVLICRPREGAAGRFGVALKGGHNAEHHNHNDVGSYVVVIGRTPVLADPGKEVYTQRTFGKDRYESQVLNSFGHPVPLVAGTLQRAGGNARARVLKHTFTAERDTLVLDITSAYDVPELKSLVRTFEYSRVGDGSLTVTDAVRFSKPKSFGTALISFGRFERQDANTVVVGELEETVRVKIDVEGGDHTLRTEELKEDQGLPTHPTRLGIDLEKPVRETRIRLTITPERASKSQGRSEWCRNAIGSSL